MTETQVCSLEISGSVAWAFAGQGSQVPVMGRDIYEEFMQVREIFENTSAGFDLKEMCFEASAEVLGDTRYTQASMAAFAAAVVRVLKDGGLVPATTLGLSLGEYSALHAAGAFGVDELLGLLGFRGAIMADASKILSRMTAVLGLEDTVVEEAVADAAAKTGGIVSCTNYNCPAQVVIGGECLAVEAAEELLKQRGARRLMPLKTSGPFHTALMELPAQKLAERLSETDIFPQQIPIVFNATAATASDTQVRDLLTKQIYSPVRFAQSIKVLEAAGITRIIEIGPGKVLAGLVKKTASNIETTSIETAEDLRRILEEKAQWQAV